MTHIKTSDILAYISGNVSEGDSFRLETHLADCDECAKKVSRLNYIRENFDDIWDSLTAENLAKDLLELRLLESIEETDLEPEIRHRVISWIKNSSRKAQVVMGFVVDASKRRIEILEASAREMGALAKLPSYVPVGEPVRVLGEDLEEEARHEQRQGPNGEKIDLYYSEGMMQFKVTLTPLNPPFPLLLFYPKKGGPSIIKATRRPEETDYLVAEMSIDEPIDLSRYLVFPIDLDRSVVSSGDHDL